MSLPVDNISVGMNSSFDMWDLENCCRFRNSNEAYCRASLSDSPTCLPNIAFVDSQRDPDGSRAAYSGDRSSPRAEFHAAGME